MQMISRKANKMSTSRYFYNSDRKLKIISLLNEGKKDEAIRLFWTWIKQETFTLSDFKELLETLGAK